MAEYQITDRGMRMLEGVKSGTGNTIVEQVMPSMDPNVTAQLFTYLDAVGTQGGTITDEQINAVADQFGIPLAQVQKLLSGAVMMGYIKKVQPGWRNSGH